MELKKSDFYFDLPQELIAQDPLKDRSASRLLVLNKQTGNIEHHTFHEITDYLQPGDCLVLNDTKVIPARLLGVREDTGAAVEVLLLKRKEKDVWETLVKPGKKARPGMRLVFGDGILKAEVLEIVEEGNRLIRFRWTDLARCRCRLILPTNCRTETVIRPYMPDMRVPRQRLPPVCILQHSFFMPLRKKAWISPMSRCMWDLVHFDR